jgi:hypothetical protein
MALSLAPTLGFFFLTGNSVVAVRRSRGDAAATTFIIVSYYCLVLLFYFLRRFETAAPAAAADKDQAKNGVWLTTTLLIAMFSWRVAVLMPWPVASGVWLMAVATTLGGITPSSFFQGQRTEDDNSNRLECNKYCQSNGCMVYRHVVLCEKSGISVYVKFIYTHIV